MSQRTELLWLLAHLAVPKPWLSCLCAGQPPLHVCWDPEWGNRAVYQKSFQTWKYIMDFWGKIFSCFQNSIIKPVERDSLVWKLCASFSWYEQLPKLTAQWAERALCSYEGILICLASSNQLQKYVQHLYQESPQTEAKQIALTMLVKAEHPWCCEHRAVLHGLVGKINVCADVGRVGSISWHQENKHLCFLQAESETVLWLFWGEENVQIKWLLRNILFDRNDQWGKVWDVHFGFMKSLLVDVRLRALSCLLHLAHR